MNYSKLTPADKGILTCTIDLNLHISDDVLIGILIDTINEEWMCTEDEAENLAIETTDLYFQLVS